MQCGGPFCIKEVGVCILQMSQKLSELFNVTSGSMNLQLKGFGLSKVPLAFLALL